MMSQSPPVPSLPGRSRRTLRVLTYNVHRWRGWDHRIRPDRILELLGRLDVDIAALQEVVLSSDTHHRYPSAAAISHRLRRYCVLGPTRLHRGHLFGNLILSRFPIRTVAIYDLTYPRREPRSCLRVDVAWAESCTLHVFNVHLGTSPAERRYQVAQLVSRHILQNPAVHGPRLLLGDFNEWHPHGLEPLRSVRLRTWRTQATYPSWLPLLALDQIYFDGHFHLERLERIRTRTAHVASDHLPLVAELRLLPTQRASSSR